MLDAPARIRCGCGGISSPTAPPALDRRPQLRAALAHPGKRIPETTTVLPAPSRRIPRPAASQGSGGSSAAGTVIRITIWQIVEGRDKD
jgi:hypothetical protein